MLRSRGFSALATVRRNWAPTPFACINYRCCATQVTSTAHSMHTRFPPMPAESTLNTSTLVQVNGTEQTTSAEATTAEHTQGKLPTVFVPMAADLIHAGHINILKISKQYGHVIVGLISDEGMATYKRSPILPYEQRAALLQCFEQVDEVIQLDGVDYTKPLLALKPDFMVHGSDWADPSSPQFQARADSIQVMQSWNGQVIEPAYTEGVSTTQIIKRCASHVKPTVSTIPARTLRDVWLYIPNQIDYLRFIMGVAPVILPHQYYMLSAALYFNSHVLDQIDGKVARALGQTSHFGVILDYTVDIITGAVFMLKMCSLPAAPAAFIIPCASVISIETAGLVLAVNASASGRYWKGTDDGTPYILRNVIMKDGKYTNFGHCCVMAHHALVSSAWLWVFDPCSTWLGLAAAMAPMAAINLWANAAIVYELLRKWEEPRTP
eukprot:gnl/TRDRNA2_/TRDRNA2_83373_c0_seq1.p1 gnl/TRDRNA2_/TRDRNA2_83373_c0~~gnl/TRDRNA2_/TRDRNA2_83373_c0_seq1.p1  ORF type:complete len:438 (+),score=46.31 gnl/TRDRNA2_/TRDRNA2_83373_c0_seq1:64-1377(+)